MSDLKQLLADSKGLPSAFRKSHPVNTVWRGQVTKVAVQQTRDDDGNLEHWDDGNPKQQVVVAIKTDQRDPERPHDDGIRGIYIKWWGEQRKALRDCLEAAGVDDIEPGGMFAAQYIGDGPQPQNKMYSPAKLMRYEYRPPSPTAGLFSQNGNGASAPQQAAPQQAAPPPPPQPPTDPWDAAPTADPWGAAPPVATAAATPARDSIFDPPAQPPAANSMFGTPAPGLGSIVDAPAPAAAPPPPPPSPAATAAVPPPAAPADPMALLATVKAYIALGMTDAQINGAVGVDVNAVQAIRNLPA